MYVDEITLKNFRNYEKGHAVFDRGVNIIYGPNAMGKTNIMEAVFMMSYARSHRYASEREMIREGCDFAGINSVFHSKGRRFEGEIKIFPHKKKQIKINKISINKTSELMGYLNVVMFCPEDLRIVKGAPRERRRVMDFGMCQLSKKYLHALSQYIRVLEQRNKLLKENPESPSLWVWDGEMARHGSEVIYMRKAFIDMIGAHAAGVQRDISREKLEIIYKCGVNLEDFSSVDVIRGQFEAELKKNAGREKRFGISLTGPHRDDFDIFINSKDAKAYASQGQQRTAALSVKIAEVFLVREKKGEAPVLLLDDVMSELDSLRQSYIMDIVEDAQVIITCTALPEYRSANIIRVEDVKK